jgi:histidinol-phosphatase (PHP family)
MTTLHTHCTYSDGHDDIETLCKTAYDKGLSAIGISSHAPLEEKLKMPAPWCMKSERLPDYCREVHAAKERWAGKIDVLLGLEVDYIDGLCGPADDDMQKIKTQYDFDYFIGSTHYVVSPDGKYLAADAKADILEQGIKDYFNGDGELFAELYYKCLANMCRKGGFEIVAHFDLVKKNNDKLHFFNPESPRCQAALMEAVDAAAEASKREGIKVEINTGGMNRGWTSEPYPSRDILKALKARGVPFIITSDAHKASDLDGHYAYAEEMLKTI